MTSPREQNGDNALQDQRLDQILAALNRAEAPAALERRVLQRIDQREEAFLHKPRRVFTTPAPPWRLAALCAAAVLLAAFLLIHGDKRSKEQGARIPLPTPSQVATAEARSVQSEPFSHANSRHFDRRPRLCGRSGETPVLRTSNEPSAKRSATERDQATLADGPAPELPLTEQERLLVRIAYGARPQQMASLKRFAVRLHPDDDGPDFRTFFEPYTTPLTEGDPQ